MARANGPVGFERGSTFYGTDGDILSNPVQSAGLEGTEVVFPDKDPANPIVRRSDNDVMAIIVRNSTGVTLYAGQLVSWSGGTRKKRVGRLCYQLGERVAGVVDDFLGVGGVRNGDLFYLLVKGPCLAQLSITPADLSPVIAVDDFLIATAGTAATDPVAGGFRSWCGTWSATETTDGTATRIGKNMFGRAMSAATTANTGVKLLVELTL
jgi:hypothetical protein